METKANYVVVGVFTVLAFLAAFAFVYWIARNNSAADQVPLNFVIEGSVTGLQAGSAVRFNGIRVGTVRKVGFRRQEPNKVFVETVVDPTIPLTDGTKASVGFADLTGVANIELEGADSEGRNLFELAQEQGGVPSVTASPSALNNILQTTQTILTRAQSTLDELQTFVKNARAPLNDTVENVRQFSSALSDSSDDIGTFLDGAGKIGQALADVSGKLDATIAGVEGLVKAVKPEEVTAIVSNVEKITANVSSASDRVDAIVADAGAVTAELRTFGTRANATLDRVDQLVGAVSPDQVTTLVGEASEAAKSARSALADVAEVTKTFSARTGDVDAIIANTRKMTEELNAAAVRIDGVVQKVDSFLGDAEGTEVLADASRLMKRADELLSSVSPEDVGNAVRNLNEATSTARTAVADIAKVTEKIGARSEEIDTILSNVGQMSQRLNEASTRVDGILAKIDGFFGEGNTDSLVAEARATLQSFRSVATNLDARLAEIAGGLTRFTGQGLRDVEALVRNASRSVSRIEQAVTDIERNPQRLIFGGEGDVKTFQGRQRR